MGVIITTLCSIARIFILVWISVSR